jgi:hypothetical protein
MYHKDELIKIVIHADIHLLIVCLSTLHPRAISLQKPDLSHFGEER